MVTPRFAILFKVQGIIINTSYMILPKGTVNMHIHASQQTFRLLD